MSNVHVSDLTVLKLSLSILEEEMNLLSRDRKACQGNSHPILTKKGDSDGKVVRYAGSHV